MKPSIGAYESKQIIKVSWRKALIFEPSTSSLELIYVALEKIKTQTRHLRQRSLGIIVHTITVHRITDRGCNVSNGALTNLLCIKHLRIVDEQN